MMTHLKIALLLVLFATITILTGCANSPQVKEIQISDAEIHAEYDALVAQWPKFDRKEYKVRHILTPTQDQAQKALDRIKAGESFNDVAKNTTIDINSGKIDGELGWSSPYKFVDEFSKPMEALAPRGISSYPIRTRYGWHIIEVTEVRPTLPPSYDDLKEDIAQELIKRRKAKKQQ